ncbi:hypothetical protein Emin_0128 [Elusimicrobium minutum Pei191]|uniref:Uncharacterized protein n=1 Tax=Elusimicrobium minutum (strain Pei191) TaxID=445932 RepID=B2KAZ8_ELUMP|nr:PTS sugar transporter subunit IIC [Elusimicrobium minutum]ACC97694.1 hypothetical protein Emin_0128 [Elusimicrobium minutum Pei191]
MQLIILVCLVAALLELDNVSFGQFGVGRPFVAGIILGFFMGNIGLGLQIGVLIELLFLDYIPVGGVLPPNGTVAVFAAVVAAGFGAPVYFAFFYGVVAGLIFKQIEFLTRNYIGKKLLEKNKELTEEPLKAIKVFMISSLTLQIVLNFAFLMFVVFAAKTVLYYGQDVHERIHFAFRTAYIAVPWMGIFILLRKFTEKAG